MALFESKQKLLIGFKSGDVMELVLLNIARVTELLDPGC